MSQQLMSLEDGESVPAQTNTCLRMYRKEIGQYKILSCEEANELAIRYLEQNDQEAVQQLV